jgi:hypothetical protein
MSDDDKAVIYRGLALGREAVEEIRREAGWDPDEENDPETLNRYIEALEASVAGQRAAAHAIATARR